MTNLSIFNRHGMPLEQIAKSMDIAFLALLNQLLEVGHFITALEKIDMNNRPLLFSYFALSKMLLKGISVLGVSIQLNKEESILCFFSCIPFEELKEFCGGH